MEKSMFEITDPNIAVLVSDGLFFLGIALLLMVGYWFLKVSRRKREGMQKVNTELDRIFSQSQDDKVSRPEEDKD